MSHYPCISKLTGIFKKNKSGKKTRSYRNGPFAALGFKKQQIFSKYTVKIKFKFWQHVTLVGSV